MEAAKALSVNQPWAWAIVNGYKPVENRVWPTKFRGPVLIHASKRERTADVSWVMDAVASQTGMQRAFVTEMYEKQRRLGAIVGAAQIIDCVTEMEGVWFCGPYGFVLSAAHPIHPVPCRGMQRFFTVPQEVLDAVRSGAENGSWK